MCAREKRGQTKEMETTWENTRSGMNRKPRVYSTTVKETLNWGEVRLVHGEGHKEVKVEI